MKNSEKFPLSQAISRDLKKYLSFVWDDIKGEDSKFLCAGGFPRYIGLLQIALDGDKRAQDLFEDWELLKDSLAKNMTLKDVIRQLLSCSDTELFETYSGFETPKYSDMPFYLARFFIAPYVRKEAFEMTPGKKSITEINECHLTLKGQQNRSERDIDFFIRDEKALLDFLLRLKDNIYSWINQNKKNQGVVSPVAMGNIKPGPMSFNPTPVSVPTSLSNFITSGQNLSKLEKPGSQINGISPDDCDNSLFLSEESRIYKPREYWTLLLEDCPQFIPFEDEIPLTVEKNKQKDIKAIEDLVMRGIRSAEDLAVREKILCWIFHDPGDRSLIGLPSDIFLDIETTKERSVSHEKDTLCYKFALGIFREIYVPALERKMSIEDAKHHLQCIEGDYILHNFASNYNTSYTKYATSIIHERLKIKNLVKFLDDLIESMPENMSVKIFLQRIERDISLIDFKNLEDDSPSPDGRRRLFNIWKKHCAEFIHLPKIQFVTGEDLLFRNENRLFDDFDIQNCVWKLCVSPDDAASIEVSKEALQADLDHYFKINHGKSLFTAKRLRKYTSREKYKKVLHSDEALREWCNNLFFECFEKENSKGVRYSKRAIQEMAAFWDIPHDIVCMFVGSFDIKQIEEIDEDINYNDCDADYGSLARKKSKKKIIAKRHDWAMTYMNMQEEKQKGEKNDE